MNAQECLESECIEHSRLENQRLIAIQLGDIGSACRAWAAMESSDRRKERIKDEIRWRELGLAMSLLLSE